MHRMDKFPLVESYLNDYTELWQEISGNSLPCGDPCLDIIDDSDYYDCDFSGNQSVYQFFFTGDSTYFPAICNVKDIRHIDRYPIYIFNFEEAESGSLGQSIGNFKIYMKTLLKEYLQTKPTGEFKSQAKQALKDLQQFSSRLIPSEYHLIINEQ